MGRQDGKSPSPGPAGGVAAHGHGRGPRDAVAVPELALAPAPERVQRAVVGDGRGVVLAALPGPGGAGSRRF